MSYINMHLQYANMHAHNGIMHAQYILQAQHTNMHAQNANMHPQYINMRYAHATCHYAGIVWMLEVQHAIMQAQYACAECMCTIQPPGMPKHQSSWMTPQGDFPITLVELAEKPSPLGNKCKGQMGEPLPTCKVSNCKLDSLRYLITLLLHATG